MSGVKVNKVLKQFSKANNHRIAAFTVETPDGSTIEFQGCVTKADSERVMKMVREIIAMTDKVEAAAVGKRGRAL